MGMKIRILLIAIWGSPGLLLAHSVEVSVLATAMWIMAVCAHSPWLLWRLVCDVRLFEIVWSLRLREDRFKK